MHEKFILLALTLWLTVCKHTRNFKSLNTDFKNSTFNTNNLIITQLHRSLGNLKFRE